MSAFIGVPVSLMAFALVRRVFSLYLRGMAVDDIVESMNTLHRCEFDSREINHIVDRMLVLHDL